MILRKETETVDGGQLLIYDAVPADPNSVENVAFVLVDADTDVVKAKFTMTRDDAVDLGRSLVNLYHDAVG